MLITGDVLAPVMAQLVEAVRASQRAKRLYASGKSAASLRFSFSPTPNGLQADLFGAGHWIQQQNGRGPNPSGKPSRDMVNAIRAWTLLRGIPVAAAYPIAINIARRGITVPNRYNSGGVLSEPLSPANVGKLATPALRSFYGAELKTRLLA